MTPRTASLFLVLAPLVWLTYGATDLRAADSKVALPNFLIIFTDDQGYHDVGCYGSEIPTPHIDRLAREGLKFTSCYAASSICTPSRFGLLTGRNPSRSHDRLLEALMFLSPRDANRGIHAHETTLGKVLSGQGYRTALLGKWHLGHGRGKFLPTRHGFDIFRGHTGGCIDYFTMTYGMRPDWYNGERYSQATGYATELITDYAVQFLEQQRRAQEPFFLFLAYNAPHFGKGWSPADQQPVNIMQPQAAELRRAAGIAAKIRREFAAMTIALDDGVGKVLQTLDQTGLAGETLVVFMTDHGGDPVYGGSNEPFRGDKATLFEGGIRVPCLMRLPGRIQAGSVTDEVVSALDLFPTLCELAGIDTGPYLLDGEDLSGLLFEQRGWPEPRELFWELAAHQELGRGGWQALRQGVFKYLRDDRNHRYLFDLKRDPSEAKNLWEVEPQLGHKMQQRALELSAELRAEHLIAPAP